MQYNSIQIMTDPSANRKSIWFSGFSRAWKQLTITLGFASGNSRLSPGPPESLEPDRFSCCPRDQSLFVYYYSTLILYNLTLLF